MQLHSAPELQVIVAVEMNVPAVIPPLPSECGSVSEPCNRSVTVAGFSLTHKQVPAEKNRSRIIIRASKLVMEQMRKDVLQAQTEGRSSTYPQSLKGPMLGEHAAVLALLEWARRRRALHHRERERGFLPSALSVFNNSREVFSIGSCCWLH